MPGGGGGVTDGDKGDIVVSGGGTVWSLDAGVIPGVFTSVDDGLAPASGGGTANFLRADGTWTAPPGGSGGGEKVVVTVDFGAGSDLATAVVTGQAWVTSASAITATLGSATADHDAEDGLIEGITLTVADLVVGDGFTVYAHAPYGTHGQYSINCTGVA